MSYRPATCIELLDTHVGFATKDNGYLDIVLPGRTEYGPRPAFKIPLQDLMNAAQAFGLGSDQHGSAGIVSPGGTHQTMADTHAKGGLFVDNSNYEVNVFDYIDDVGAKVNGPQIVSLEVEVLAAQLANIRIGYEWDDGEVTTYEMTYSGRFQVWWEPQA